MQPDRPVLASIDEHLADDGATVAVTLTAGGRSFVGEAKGDAEPAHRARLVGEATLRAVESYSSGAYSLDLQAVGTSEIGAVRVALAQVVEAGDGELVGSALISQGDPLTAAARAVLDAVNRRLGKDRNLRL